MGGQIYVDCQKIDCYRSLTDQPICVRKQKTERILTAIPQLIKRNLAPRARPAGI